MERSSGNEKELRDLVFECLAGSVERERKREKNVEEKEKKRKIEKNERERKEGNKRYERIEKPF